MPSSIRRLLRLAAILTIASAYLFTALILIFWFLTFPGVFGSTSLIGGLQSTVWLYVVWHFGFPLFVIRYALTKDAEPSQRLWYGTVRRAIGTRIAATVALASVAVGICVIGEPFLPRLMLDPLRLGPLWPWVGAPLAVVSVAALVALWRRRQSMLDLWLMVVMCLYLVEVPLSLQVRALR